MRGRARCSTIYSYALSCEPVGITKGPQWILISAPRRSPPRGWLVRWEGLDAGVASAGASSAGHSLHSVYLGEPDEGTGVAGAASRTVAGAAGRKDLAWASLREVSKN